MATIKRFISLIFLTVTCLSILTFFSIQGEKDYQKSCNNLGLECEEGKVHEMLNIVKPKLSKAFDELKKELKL